MKIEKLTNSIVAIIVGVLVVVGSVQAATTISENISTGGTLSVTGTSTLMGNVGIGTTTLYFDDHVPKLSVYNEDSNQAISARFINSGFPEKYLEISTDIYGGEIGITAGNTDGGRRMIAGYFSGDDTIGIMDGMVFGSVPNNELTINAGNTVFNGTINGVKVYRALLTQSGTNAPVATVLENSLGGEVVWSYEDAGLYLGTLVSAFTPDKTFLSSHVDTQFTSNEEFISRLGYFSSDTVVLTNLNSSVVGVDGLGRAYIEILVYP